MNFKTILLFITVVFVFSSLAAQVESFKANPASLVLSDDDYLLIPGLSFGMNINNSLLQLDDMKIFDLANYEPGEVLSDADKALLSKNDLDIEAEVNLPILGFGYKNWGFKLGMISYADVKLLDKQFTDLVLNGNETNLDYTTYSGDNSFAYSFFKASFSYAFQEPISYEKLIKSTTQSDNNFLKFIKNMPIYYGVNLNFYYPSYYAKMNRSTQNFGSFDDSLYYNLQMDYDMFDERSVGRISTSLGLGLMFNLQKGWFHFRLDDLFGNLNYRNLSSYYSEQNFMNELNYFDSAYQPDHEETEIDSLRIKDKTVDLPASIETGIEYLIYGNFGMTAKYKNIQYECKNGVSLGLSYAGKTGLPFELIYGFGETPYYELKSGVKFNKMDLLFNTTFYQGLFRYAKGFAVSTELIYKF